MRYLHKMLEVKVCWEDCVCLVRLSVRTYFFIHKTTERILTACFIGNIHGKLRCSLFQSNANPNLYADQT
jgi:hypothetical protein